MKTPPIALDRAARYGLLAGALIACLPHGLHLPVSLNLLAALLLLAAFSQIHQDQAAPSRWLLLLLVGSCCALILFEFRTLFGRDAGVATLVLFMSLKLLEMRSARDGFVVITLGYFLLLTHYFYSQTLLTGLWLIGALWLLTACMIRLQSPRSTAITLLFRQAGRLGLQALPLMLLLYLLFPRVDGPLWGLPQDAHAGRTGLSDTLRMGHISQLVQSGDIAFRVRFDDPPPPRQQLYWRGPVLERFDGETWHPASGDDPPPRIEVLSPALRYESTLEAHGKRWLLALDAPGALPANSRLDGRMTVLAKDNLDQRQRWTFASHLDYRLNSIEMPHIRQRNQQLPPRGNPRSRALAVDWRQSEKSDQAFVDRVLRHFAEQPFYYTLQPPLLGADAIDDFLFDRRRGFCEHYAASFVFLMRAAGIPARIVGGYQGGELNPLDNYWVIRQSDAHAWSEVWLSDRGWVRVDPTAAVAPSRIEHGIVDALPTGEALPAIIQLRGDWARNLRHRWEALNNAWNQHVLGYDLAKQRRLLAQLGWPEADWRQLSALLAGLGGLVVLGLTLWALYQRPSGDPASRLWQQALRQLARRNVHLAPGETPNTFAHRVAQAHPDLAPRLNRVVDHYLQVRYGDLAQALPALRQAVAELARWSSR
ncbi:MAG: DUF3488 and transglutaminase-like domain-containing protein [Dechloromonas sp.]|nr:DUF3488 and transglutaminase-like domain-containing protein [Dechloromonas sp.]